MGWIVQEFRKRHLFGAVAAYVLAAAGLLAGLRALARVVALPSWSDALAVLLLALGLPLVLIAVWRRARRGPPRGPRDPRGPHGGATSA